MQTKLENPIAEAVLYEGVNRLPGMHFDAIKNSSVVEHVTDVSVPENSGNTSGIQTGFDLKQKVQSLLTHTVILTVVLTLPSAAFCPLDRVSMGQSYSRQ